MGYQRFGRPLSYNERSRITGGAISTAASTTLQPNQQLALQTTATGAPVVYTIAPNVKAGDVLELAAHMVASSSVAPFHITAQSSGAFAYAAATTPQNLLKLSTVGAGVRMVALNSSEWLVSGLTTLATST